MDVRRLGFTPESAEASFAVSDQPAQAFNLILASIELSGDNAHIAVWIGERLVQPSISNACGL